MNGFRIAGAGSTVVAEGELDMSAAAALQRSIGEAIQGERVQLTIDMAQVTFIDSSCLNELIRPTRDGHRVTVSGAPPAVLRLIELMGLDTVLDIVDSHPGD